MLGGEGKGEVGGGGRQMCVVAKVRLVVNNMLPATF